MCRACDILVLWINWLKNVLVRIVCRDPQALRSMGIDVMDRDRTWRSTGGGGGGGGGMGGGGMGGGGMGGGNHAYRRDDDRRSAEGPGSCCAHSPA